MVGVVLSRAGGRYRVRIGDETIVASLRGRVKHRAERRVLVGDHVRVGRGAMGETAIDDVLPRRTVLRRRTPGGRHGVREIVANVDRVVVVGSVRQPEWDHHLIDRFVAVAQANALAVVVVVNKSDLAGDVTACAGPYRTAGYEVLVTSTITGAGLASLRPRLEDAVSVLTGPTGVGKSSLLNALQPGLRLRTDRVSTRSRTGRHTTVAAEMYPFGRAGFVVDTPGLQDIGLWGLEPQEVAAAFPEIGGHAAACRFDDCRHLGEPGCAIVDAVTRAEIPETRLESYRRLLAESLQAAKPWERS